MEAAGPLTHGQLKSLGVRAGWAHAKAGEQGYLPMAVVVQLPMMVA